MRAIKTLEPWLICGDLYCVMNSDERICSLVRESEMEDIINCMGDCALSDIKGYGNFYTGNNK